MMQISYTTKTAKRKQENRAVAGKPLVLYCSISNISAVCIQYVYD